MGNVVKGDLMYTFGDIAFYLEVVDDFLNMADDLRNKATAIEKGEIIYRSPFYWQDIRNVLFMMLVSKFGDYSITPRSGWITKPRECADAIYDAFDFDYYAKNSSLDSFREMFGVGLRSDGTWEMIGSYLPTKEEEDMANEAIDTTKNNTDNYDIEDKYE